MTLETIAPLSESAAVSLPALAAWPNRPCRHRGDRRPSYTTPRDTTGAPPPRAPRHRPQDGLAGPGAAWRRPARRRRSHASAPPSLRASSPSLTGSGGRRYAPASSGAAKRGSCATDSGATRTRSSPGSSSASSSQFCRPSFLDPFWKTSGAEGCQLPMRPPGGQLMPVILPQSGIRQAEAAAPIRKLCPGSGCSWRTHFPQAPIPGDRRFVSQCSMRRVISDAQLG